MSVYYNERFAVWVATIRDTDGKIKKGAYSTERLADQAAQNNSISHDAEYEYDKTVGSFCLFFPMAI